MSFFNPFQSQKAGADESAVKKEPVINSGAESQESDPWALDARAEEPLFVDAAEQKPVQEQPSAAQDPLAKVEPAPWADAGGEAKPVEDKFDDSWIKDDEPVALDPYETMPKDARVDAAPAPLLDEPIPNADPHADPITPPPAAESSRRFSKRQSRMEDMELEEEISKAEVMTNLVPKNEAVKSRDPRTRRIEIEVPSEEELFARRRTRDRLVGAAVLLLTAVVVAPFVFDSEESFTKTSISTEIPAVEENRSVLKIPEAGAEQDEKSDVELSGSSMGADASTAKTNLENEGRKGAEAAASVEMKPKQKPQAEEKPKAAEVEKKPEKTPSGYYIQVGAYSSKANAEKYADQIKRLGVPVFVSEIKRSSGKNLWAVRVGPFKSTKGRDAQGALGTLQLNGIIDGKAYFAK